MYKIHAIALHRKIGGLYLLANKFGARVDIRHLFLRDAAAERASGLDRNA